MLKQSHINITSCIILYEQIVHNPYSTHFHNALKNIDSVDLMTLPANPEFMITVGVPQPGSGGATGGGGGGRGADVSVGIPGGGRGGGGGGGGGGGAAAGIVDVGPFDTGRGVRKTVQADPLLSA